MERGTMLVSILVFRNCHFFQHENLFFFFIREKKIMCYTICALIKEGKKSFAFKMEESC